MFPDSSFTRTVQSSCRSSGHPDNTVFFQSLLLCTILPPYFLSGSNPEHLVTFLTTTVTFCLSKPRCLTPFTEYGPTILNLFTIHQSTTYLKFTLRTFKGLSNLHFSLSYFSVPNKDSKTGVVDC